jgi:ADP-ribosylglycohydrolase
MGMPTEWMERDLILKTYGEIAGFVDPHPKHPRATRGGMQAGQYTDDTAFSLALAEVLAAGPDRLDRATFVQSLLDADRQLRSGHTVREPGSATAAALISLHEGVNNAAVKSRSCGPSTRVAPLGLFMFYRNRQDIWSTAHSYAAITHDDAVACDAAATIACTVAEVVHRHLHGTPTTVDDVIDIVVQVLDGYESNGYLRQLVEAYTGQVRLSRWENVLPYDHSPDSASVLCTALGILVSSRGRVRDAALLAARAGGDSDSVAGIACCIAGAMSGVAGIPRQWYEGKRGAIVQDAVFIRRVARKLLTRVRREDLGFEEHRMVAPLRSLSSQTRTRKFESLRSLLREQGLVSIREAYEAFGLSALDLGTFIEKLGPDVVLAPRGLMLIDSERAAQYGPDYLQFSRDAAQVDAAARALTTAYGKTANANVRDSLANLIERVGDESAADAIAEFHPDHARALRTRLVFECLLESLASSVGQVVEGDYVRMQVVFADQTNDFEPHLQSHRYSATKIQLFDVDSTRRLAEMRRVMSTPGLYLMTTAGELSGPFELAEAECVETGMASTYPANDRPLADVSAQLGVHACFSLYPNRRRLYCFMDGQCMAQSQHLDSSLLWYLPTPGMIVNQAQPPVTVRDAGLHAESVKRTRLVQTLVNTAHYHSCTSVHGCTLFAVNDADAFVREYKDMLNRDLVSSCDIATWPLSDISAVANQDGAVIVDLARARIVAYGIKLSSAAKFERKAMLQSGSVLGRHGTRHISAAASTIEYPDSVAVVVSERGSVTVFSAGSVAMRFD